MEIFINNIQLKIRKKNIKNQYEYHMINSDIFFKKDIITFDVICDECNKLTKLSNFPTTKENTYLCRSCRQIGENNPMFGKKWSKEQKKIKSELTTGENNPMYGRSVYDVWLEKYGKDIADEKYKMFLDKMSITSSGENNPMYGRSIYDVWLEKYGKDIANEKLNKFKNIHSIWLKNNKDHHEKMILNSHKKYHKTSIERDVENFLIENKINFKYNYINKYQYDFLLFDYNIIIETHGDYWHGNPNIYSDEDDNLKNLNEQQRYKKQLDIIKHTYIKDKYDIIYLWETDIKNKNYKKILWNLLKLKK